MFSNASLSIPKQATSDAHSYELARVWVANKGLHCALRIGAFSEQGIDETQAWGIVLADISRHAARAISRDSHASEEEVRQRILISFVNESSARITITVTVTENLTGGREAVAI